MQFELWAQSASRNHAKDGVPIPHDNGQFWGKGSPIVKYRHFLLLAMQKRLNRSICCLGYGLEWAQGIMLDGDPAVLRDVAMASNFGPQFAIIGFVGYNFSCMIASDTLFDSSGGFSESSYPMKT